MDYPSKLAGGEYTTEVNLPPDGVALFLWEITTAHEDYGDFTRWGTPVTRDLAPRSPDATTCTSGSCTPSWQRKRPSWAPRIIVVFWTMTTQIW